MDPAEIWWIISARTAQMKHLKAGGKLSQAEVEELYEFSIAQGIFTRDG